jgi:hypothetical protein
VEANVSSNNVSPNPWCGLVGRKQRPTFDCYWNVLVGYFVIWCSMVRLFNLYISNNNIGEFVWNFGNMLTAPRDTKIGYDIVASLMIGFHGCGHSIFTNNFFTLVKLLIDLEELETNCIKHHFN